MKVVYRITYPNGKIYVGKDLTGTANYFGSADSRVIEQDFTIEERADFTIRKEIIWQSDTATDREVGQREVQLIRELSSNDPEVGYNRWPPFRPRQPSETREFEREGRRRLGLLRVLHTCCPTGPNRGQRHTTRGRWSFRKSLSHNT